jgi:hypothetical protein
MAVGNIVLADYVEESTVVRAAWRANGLLGEAQQQLLLQPDTSSLLTPPAQQQGQGKWPHVMTTT